MSTAEDPTKQLGRSSLERAFRNEFQIHPETGMSQDFFNELYVFRRADVKMNLVPPGTPVPERYQALTPEETEAYVERMRQAGREILLETLKKMPTYTQWASEWAQNRRFREKYGDKVVEWLISDQTRDRVASLDAKIEEMKEIGKGDPLDFQRLAELAGEATLLIYGDEMGSDIRGIFTDINR